MAVTNPFKITYIDREVGGSTSYQLLGPYVIDKGHDHLRLVFDVIVVGTSHANLQSKCDDLETDFRKRMEHDDVLKIDIGGSVWTYTHGTNLFDGSASLTKSGNPETDFGFSRAYTCTVEAQLPADQDNGLRSVEVVVDYTPSRQRTVTMRGTYTGLSGANAKTKYEADFDSEASEYLDAVDSSATWELVDESGVFGTRHRGSSNNPFPHLWHFTRQYSELIHEQLLSTLDDTTIKDHRVNFSDLSNHPGDSRQDIYRLRRCIGTYECAIDIDVSTDLYDAFEKKVRPHLIAHFEANFKPTVFALDSKKVSYDETAKRMSVEFQFIYQAPQSEAVVEIAQSCAFRESRTIDYTPVHGKSEFSMNADPGWTVLHRIWSRVVIVVGSENPKVRIAEKPLAGDAGPFSDTIGGQDGPDKHGGKNPVRAEGWNVIESTSEVVDTYIGDSELHGQMRLARLNETVIEQYHRAPDQTTGPPIQKGAKNPGK